MNLKVFKNSFLSVLGMGLPLLAAFFATPNLIKALGDREFGVLTLIWALLGYFGIFDFGVGRALTVLLGASRGNQLTKDDSYLPGILMSGLLMSLVAALLSMLLTWFFLFWFLGAEIRVSSRGTWSAPEREALLLCVWGIIPTVMTNTLRGALEGLDRFLESSAIRGLTGAAVFVGPMLVSYLSPLSLKMACLSIIIFRWLGMFWGMYCLRKPLLLCKWSYFSQVTMRKILSFGSWVTVSTIISPIMVHGDRFFLSMWLGPESLPKYAVPQEILQRLLIFPFAFGAALLPMVSNISLSSQTEISNQSERIHDQFKKNLWVAIVMMAGLIFFVLSAAELFMGWWISPEFAAQSIKIIFILSLGVFANGIAQVPYTFLHAWGATKITAMIHIAEVPLYFLTLRWMVSNFDVLGAAWTWVMRAVLDLALLYMAYRRLVRRLS